MDASRIAGWLETLDDDTVLQVLAAAQVLGQDGPSLGRPLVDTIKASRHKNMKELRPGSSGRSEIRILFAFDKRRSAILLLGGDKSGDWQRWYKRAIPEADRLFDEHLQTMKGETDG